MGGILDSQDCSSPLTPLKVLIVEDSEDDAFLLVRTLRKGGFEAVFKTVETREDMREALCKGAWDVVLSDYIMPHFDGPAAIAVLKESGLDIPIIIVSGKIGEEIAVEAMKAGAHDYIMKGHLSRLIPAIKRELNDMSVRSAKRQAEEALREIEERYRTALESSSDAFALIEGEKILHVNKQFLRTFGYSSFIEISDRSPFFMVHPDDRNRVIEYHRKKLLIEPAPALLEFWAIRSDGSVIAIEISIATTTYKGVLVSLAYLRDTTMRKTAEEERLRLFNLSIDMFSIAGFDGYFKQVNPAWELTLGWKTEELLSKPSIDFIHPDDHATTLEATRVMLANGMSLIGFENRYLTLDGSFRWISWNSYPLVEEGLVFSIAQDVTERKKDSESLASMAGDLRKATDAIIEVIVMAVEIRDPYTSGHQGRVAELARAIAREMGLSKEEIDGIGMAGVTHDLGKISIPADILGIPRKLTDLEFSLVKTHSQIGHDILKDVQFTQPVALMVLQHHERLDGSGYPAGLTGDSILMGARIIAVADVVEAMVSHRPYRPALGIDAAIDEIKGFRDTAYDGRVVDACEKLFMEKAFVFR